MTSPDRYSVPIDELDAVRVPVAEQVQEQRQLTQPDATAWGGSLVPACGGGGGSNDGDSD